MQLKSASANRCNAIPLPLALHTFTLHCSCAVHNRHRHRDSCRKGKQSRISERWIKYICINKIFHMNDLHFSLLKKFRIRIYLGRCSHSLWFLQSCFTHTSRHFVSSSSICACAEIRIERKYSRWGGITGSYLQKDIQHVESIRYK